MDSAISELPENISNAAGEALNSLIPEKSKERYEVLDRGTKGGVFADQSM
jgi:hypothetical protein